MSFLRPEDDGRESVHTTSLGGAFTSVLYQGLFDYLVAKGIYAPLTQAETQRLLAMTYRMENRDHRPIQ